MIEGLQLDHAGPILVWGGSSNQGLGCQVSGRTDSPDLPTYLPIYLSIYLSLSLSRADVLGHRCSRR